jgi:DNA-binding Xre family transcriptional regulator
MGNANLALKKIKDKEKDVFFSFIKNICQLLSQQK